MEEAPNIILKGIDQLFRTSKVYIEAWFKDSGSQKKDEKAVGFNGERKPESQERAVVPARLRTAGRGTVEGVTAPSPLWHSCSKDGTQRRKIDIRNMQICVHMHHQTPRERHPCINKDTSGKREREDRKRGYNCHL